MSTCLTGGLAWNQHERDKQLCPDSHYGSKWYSGFIGTSLSHKNWDYFVNIGCKGQPPWDIKT